MPVEQYLEVAQNTSFKDVLVTFFTILQYPAITLFTAMLLEIVLPIGNNLRLQALTQQRKTYSPLCFYLFF